MLPRRQRRSQECISDKYDNCPSIPMKGKAVRVPWRSIFSSPGLLICPQAGHGITYLLGWLSSAEAVAAKGKSRLTRKEASEAMRSIQR
jgi:hypothetical protein